MVAAAGSLAAGFLRRWGLRKVLINLHWGFLLGGLLCGAADGVGMIVVGRFIVGFSGGISTVVISSYVAEMAPDVGFTVMAVDAPKLVLMVAFTSDAA